MTDDLHRQLAVDPGRSCIVQAPAGSGKTTLLVERFLRLLAVVDQPEAVLAITFTRKAAAEMRARVLELIEPGYEPAAHERSAHDAAMALTERLVEWRLLDNPQRLQIRTIDSFNHALARQMPLATMLGPVPAPADDVKVHYRRAVRRVLNLPAADPAAEAVEVLLAWRDHNRQQVEDVLANLLASRERWLRAIGVVDGVGRQALEAELASEVGRALARVRRLLTDAQRLLGIDDAQMIDALSASETSLGRPDTIASDAKLESLPGSLPLWRCLADALLVKDKPTFRVRINKTQGFEPKSSQLELWKLLLGQLNDEPDRHKSLALAMDDVRHLPEPRYADDEWAVLQALIDVMRRSAAELSLQFAATGQCDFTAIAAAALHGLGDPDSDSGVSDLALVLDHRITHILVDEFQDTNLGQMRLLERLTSGWQSGDGRTLFAVGDPMQSIYRFREAEVGLFLDARSRGIGDVALQPLSLDRNFRCRPAIVDWVNTVLGPGFPDREDPIRGAVTYAPSTPGRTYIDDQGAVLQRGFASDEEEAAWIVDHLQQALAEHGQQPDWRAAIIVRARSHLKALLPALAEADIRYRAVKLTPLLDEPVVQDLLALTALLVRRADTASLLALLRSPLVGLTLRDLEVIAGADDPVYGPAADERGSLPAGLSADGRVRAERALDLLTKAFSDLGRQPLSALVERLWTGLGGPDVWYAEEADARSARRYLELLTTSEADGVLDDWNAFVERLDALKTEGAEPSDEVRLDLLTAHSAKGLEWDLVFLPGLARQPPSSSSELLHWLPQGRDSVLIAPQRRADVARDNQNPLIAYMAREEDERERFERQRLFYVAATRAKRELVLTATMAIDAKTGETKEPNRRSQLALVWPRCDQASFRLAGHAAADTTPPTQRPDQGLRRVPAQWVPDRAPAMRWQSARAPASPGDEIEYNWAGASARRIGTVLHRLLEKVGQVGIEALSTEVQQGLLDRVPALLRSEGLNADPGDATTTSVVTAFRDTLADDQGRWMLSGEHAESACELSVTGFVDGTLVTRVIDRTFVDRDGTRWIIDYKSGEREGGDVEGFVREEAIRYREQLAEYAELMAALDGRPVRTALYLTRYQRLVEVNV